MHALQPLSWNSSEETLKATAHGLSGSRSLALFQVLQTRSGNSMCGASAVERSLTNDSMPHQVLLSEARVNLPEEDEM
jgi:hypothetical protein